MLLGERLGAAEMSKEIADRFRKMADRIEKNEGEPFGGCVLVVPPGDNAVILELLKLDPAPDAYAFWSEINSRAEEARQMLASAARSAQAGFGRR